MRGPQREKWKTNYVDMIQQESESWMDDGLDGEKEMGRSVSQQLDGKKV